jgi:hypothetical protein
MTSPPISEQIDYERIKDYVDHCADKEKITIICDLCQQLCSVFLFESILFTQKNTPTINPTLDESLQFTNDVAIQQMLQAQQQQIINNLVAQLQDSNQNLYDAKKDNRWAKAKVVGGLILGAAGIAAAVFLSYKLYYMGNDWLFPDSEAEKLKKHEAKLTKLVTSSTNKINTKQKLVIANQEILSKNVKNIGDCVDDTQEQLKKEKLKAEKYEAILEAVRDLGKKYDYLNAKISSIAINHNLIIKNMKITQASTKKLDLRATKKSLDMKNLKTNLLELEQDFCDDQKINSLVKDAEEMKKNASRGDSFFENKDKNQIEEKPKKNFFDKIFKKN